jgi:hypothetical protein
VRLLVLIASDVASHAPSAGALTAAVMAAPDAVHRLLLLAVFAPAALGAGVERPAAVAELLTAAGQVLARAAAAAQQQPACRALVDGFKHAVQEVLAAPQSPGCADLPFGLDPAAVDLGAPGAASALTCVIDGFMELAAHEMLLPALPAAGPASRAELPQRIVAAVHGLGAKALPAQVQAARRLLNLARLLGLGSRPLLERLLDEAPV